MMKDLLTYVSPERRFPELLEYAISLASKLDAHLEGVAFRFLPELSGFYATMPGEFYSTIQTRGEKGAQDACQAFVQRAADANIRHSVRNYTATQAEAARIFAHAAHCFDPAIVPQTDLDRGAFFNLNFEDILFLSGRPALFVPAIQRGAAEIDKILLCRNGDRRAARAAADALPLMKMARNIDVLQIEVGDSVPPECQAAEIVRHLRRHGISADLHVFGARTTMSALQFSPLRRIADPP